MAAFLSILVTAGLSTANTSQADSRTSTDGSLPNVLIIHPDQWRGLALGSAGDVNANTPNLDKLAREGIRFSNCYSNTPLCTPSRAMFQSGRYPTHTGIYKNNLLLSPDEYCLAEHFAEHGYATGYIGKWHLDGPAVGMVTHTQGWKYFSGFNRLHPYLGGSAEYWEGTERHRLVEGVYQPDDQTDRAINWINNQTQTNRSWLLFLSWGPPHRPFRQVPEKYLDMFDPNKLVLRPNVPEISKPPEGTPKGVWHEYETVNGVSGIRSNLQGYYAHMKALDDNVGRLLEFLELRQISDNTIIVFTSDHGSILFSHGYAAKDVPNEEEINIPLIVRWPKGIPAGRVSNELIGTIDFYPTLCGLCELPVPPEKDGVDLSHILRGRKGQSRESVYLTFGMRDGMPDLPSQGWRGVRTARYTYAYDIISNKPWVLYDNENDPLQMKNLVDEDHRDLLISMHKLLIEWLKSVDDPLAEELQW